jgi:hypothetical protein
MRPADLVGITAMGAVMTLIGGGAAVLVDDDGMTTVGLIIGSIGGVVVLFGLLALAVYAGTSAGRKS